MELKPCPNCGSTLVQLNKRKGKYQFECAGECWTSTKWCWSEIEAKEEWNNLKREEITKGKHDVQSGL